MQLTLHTDYSLRVLLYLATCEGPSTIAEIATRYGVSKNHLVKVVHKLGQKGYVQTGRGRGGGVALARKASDIRVGDVVRDMEPNFHIVECFNPETNTCGIAPGCALKHALLKAQQAFLSTLDGYTLADVSRNRATLARLLELAV